MVFYESMKTPMLYYDEQLIEVIIGHKTKVTCLCTTLSCNMFFAYVAVPECHI